MTKALKGFLLAFNMMTVIPFFKVHDFFKGINGYAAMSYPLVGFIIGLILWGASALLAPYVPPFHLGIIVFALWVGITGALHMDGFSDTIDGLFVSKERAVEVMKDPHVGGMGMTFSVVFLLLKASSVASFGAYYLLPFVLMYARFNASLAIYFFPYITKNGMSALAKEEFTRPQLLFAFLYVAALGFSFHFFFAPFLLAGLFLLLTARFFIGRLGGFSGDIYGFTIEVTELLLLNLIIIEHIR
ncbi:adenosylcobinamide-GDP ribazoletransferase [Sulfurimonas sp. HSL-1716]|uniref:adenosylcobinamide-GDP ribazoletransferase n=1 Tax=Hydrocurvibacter sulfurireducens TaxID=3131937 RepID=UPI0031F893B5